MSVFLTHVIILKAFEYFVWLLLIKIMNEIFKIVNET